MALAPEHLTQQRDKSASELVRALLIINGGGAAALLAFLQAIWTSSRELAKPTVIALIILAFGAVCAAAFHFLRHQASWQHQSGNANDWARSRRSYLTCAVLSMLAFILGVAVVSIGVLAKL